MSSTSSNTEEFTYNELMEQYVKATRLIEHLKSQRDRSKRAFDKAMDLVLKYDARIAELESLVEQLIWVGNDLLVSNTNPVTITLFNGLVCNAKERKE